MTGPNAPDGSGAGAGTPGDGSDDLDSPTMQVPAPQAPQSEPSPPAEPPTITMPALARRDRPDQQRPDQQRPDQQRPDQQRPDQERNSGRSFSPGVPFDEPTIALPRVGIRAALDQIGDETPTEPAEAGTREKSPRTADAAPGIGRASGIMAIGTLASRVTGFLRTVAITAAIGTAVVGDAYNVANTTPNILYDLLLGGVLTSVVVPVLARAAREDDDGGVGFASSLLTLVAVGLTIITLIGLVAAPLLIRLYLSRPDQIDMATTLLRYFLPQVVFYGIGATIGAILNLRNRFAAPMATPVLNNLIVIATCVVFIETAHIDPNRISTVGSGEVALLGIGTTLGIVVMTLALLPSLWASGFRFRPRLDLRHPGLRTAGRLAGWVLLFVVTNQVALTVVTRLASAAVAYTTYFTAYQLFQLPHAIIAVSVITALLPRMSRHAADNRLDLVREDLSTGLRLASVIIVPSALGLLALSRPICVAIFAHGETDIAGATRIGTTLAAFAVALVPFSSFQLQLRAFYALADSRTPTLVNFAVAGTNIATAVVLSTVLPDRYRAAALALAFAAGYLVGTILCARLLVRRLDGLDAPRILRTVSRSAVAGALAALLAFALAAVVRSLLGAGPAGSLAAVAVAGLAGAALYTVLAARMRISELTSLIDGVRGRLG
jgi:putative peptidoglycan lipid II flippase